MRVVSSFVLVATLLGYGQLGGILLQSYATPVTDSMMRIYVIDTHKGRGKGSVLVYGAENGKLLKELSTKYAPEIAVSGDGKLLFVCDTEIDAPHPLAEVRVYSTKTFELLHRSPALPSRDMYTSGPAATQFLTSYDGRYAFIPRSELRNEHYLHTYITYDVEHGSLLPHPFQLPERAAIVAMIGGRSDILFDLDGAEMEAVAWADPVNKETFETVFTFDHPFERGVEFMITQLGVSPDGKSGYLLTRNGRLRVIDLSAGKVMPEIKLRLPDGFATPMGDLIVTDDYLLVPAANEDRARAGEAQVVYVFDRWSLKSLRSIDLAPVGNRLVLSPDASKLYVSNNDDRSITTYDFTSGKSLAKIQNVAETPVWFVAAPKPE
jgi:hypothetical protein